MNKIIILIAVMFLSGCGHVELGETVGGKAYRYRLLCDNEIVMDNKKDINFNGEYWYGENKNEYTTRRFPKPGESCQIERYALTP